MVNYGGGGAGLLSPSGDVTGTMDTAAITTAMATGQRLAAGTFHVKNLTPDTGDAIIGSGLGTVLSVVSGTTGAAIALAHKSTTREVLLRDFQLNCNSISGLTGVSLDNTGLSASTPGFHQLIDVYVLDSGSDAFYYNNVIETKTDRCIAFGSGNYGFNVQNSATDGRFTNCTSGSSASHGYYASGSNNRYTGCKAYYAGYSGSFGAGHGWYVTAVNTYFSAGITFDNCEAQDCAQNGWFFDSSNGPIHSISVTGCTVDSCNAVGAGTSAAACGIQTSGLTYSSVTGNNIFNRSGGAGTMPYGISVAGTQTGLALNGNGVDVTNTGIYYVSGSGYVLTEPYQYDVSGLASAKFPASTFTGAITGSLGQPVPDYAGVFGDGSDGAVTLDGSTTYNNWSSLAGSVYTMTRDVFATSLTINNSVTLKPAGYRIFVAGALVNNGTIAGNGNNASGASAGGATGNGIVNGGGAGTNGVSGNAANPTALGLILGGGSGGNGGNGSSGTGGDGTAHKLAAAWPYRVTGPVLTAFMTFNNSTGIPSGGGAGAGGGGDGTNAGGGGGSGGGFIVIFAWTVNNGSGTISVNGGNGAAGVAGNSGGGGGGGGGLILVYTVAAWTAGTTSVAAGSLGAGTGTGAAGTGGGAGTVLNVVLQ